jgi:hypothetical protein
VNLRILGKTGHAPQIEMAGDCLRLMLAWLQDHPV